jgi:hypothetical protein
VGYCKGHFARRISGRGDMKSKRRQNRLRMSDLLLSSQW